MKKIILDFKILNTKELLFSFLKTKIDGLYSSNYDALIDALTFYKNDLTIQLINTDDYENKKELIEVLEIVKTENKMIKIINK